MPAETGYVRQIAPGAAERAVIVRPQAFGAGLGATLADAGEELNQAQLRSYRLERQQTADSEAADFNNRFASARIRMDDASRTAQANAASGGKGHAAGLEAALEKERETLLSGITEDGVRRMAESQFADYQVRFVNGERDHQEGLRIKKQVADTGEAIDTSVNRVRSSGGNAAVFAEEMNTVVSGILAAPGYSEDIRNALAEEAEQKLAAGHLSALLDRDPAGAKAAIQSGQFNAFLKPEQLEKLLSGADIEIRRVEAAQERQVTRAKAVLNEHIQTVTEMAGQGITIPDSTLDALEGAATASGDTSHAVKLSGLRAGNGFAKVWEQATPLQRERRLADLQSKGRTSADEQREIAWLKKHGVALDETFARNPHKAAVAAGLEAPPRLDLDDPDSIRARERWRRQTAPVLGRPVPFLSPAELGPMRAQYDSGDAGRTALLRDLDALPADTARADAVREIAPGDTGFQILAQITPSARAMVGEGRAILEKRKDFLSADDDDINEMVAAKDRALAFALRRVGGYDAVRAISGQFVAGAVARQGRDGNIISAPLYDTALRVALGGSGGAGGLARWNGRAYVLPETINAATFEAAVMQEARAVLNPPVNPDGSIVDLKRAIPVMVAPGRYQWESAGGRIVTTKDGSPYVSSLGGTR